MAGTARIIDLQAISTPSDSDRLAVDGLNGTESVSVADLSDTVLNKLSVAKTYSLDIGEKTLVAAINEIHKAGTDTSQEASNAKTLAENASQSASDAKTLAQSASDNASSAKTSAESAVQNATNAKTLAESASKDASSAKTLAESASQDATNAKTLAENSSQDATNAKTLAENTSNELTDAKSEIAKLKLVHRTETQSVPIDGWLSRTIDGTMYFAYTITLKNEFDPDHCTVTLLPSGSNILPTQDEAKAYNKCFATLDGKTMYICCATGVPPTAFNIKIEGIVSTSGS